MKITGPFGMPSPEEEVKLVGVRVEDMRNPRSGLVIRTCERCESPTYLSSGGLAYVSVAKAVHILCHRCAKTTLTPDDEIRMTPFVENT